MADSSIAREHECAKAAIDLNTDFEKSAHMAKIRPLDVADVSPGEMLRCLDSGVKLNIVRQAHGSLKSAAAGISAYTSFSTCCLSISPSANRAVKTAGASFPPMGDVFIVFTAHTKSLPGSL